MKLAAPALECIEEEYADDWERKRKIEQYNII
jgi:hypothetical protein